MSEEEGGQVLQTEDATLGDSSLGHADQAPRLDHRAGVLEPLTPVTAHRDMEITKTGSY